MGRAASIFRILRSTAAYGFIVLIAIICTYAILNSVTLFLWGDPSVHGEPRMFHPPPIMVLHYVGMISPGLARVIVVLLFSGLGLYAWLGFRQVTKKTSLDHPIRDQIMDFVRSHPGCHFGSIMRENGINRGTLAYHLDRLTSVGLVHKAKDGGLTRYFVYVGRISELGQKIMVHRDNPVRNQILGMLEGTAAISRTELKKGLKISGPSLWYHTQILIRDGIILAEQDPEKIGRPVQYSLTENAAKMLSMKKMGP